MIFRSSYLTMTRRERDVNYYQWPERGGRSGLSFRAFNYDGQGHVECLSDAISDFNRCVFLAEFYCAYVGSVYACKLGQLLLR